MTRPLRMARAWALIGASCMAGAPASPAPGVAVPIYGPTTGGVTTHVVAARESLASVGSRYGVSPHVIARENGLPATAGLQIGQVLEVANLHIVPLRTDAPLVINVPQRMIFLQREGEAPMGYPIAVGRSSWRTPTGPFQILVKEEQPTWDVPVSIQREMRERGQRVITRMPPCPENPLGDYWLGLSLPGIGIHGTSAPTSIYHAVTHGCIRLHPDDIHDLFARVSEGLRGEIIYEPVLLAARGGEMLLEVHPDVYARWPRDPLPGIRAALDAAGWLGVVEWQQVEAIARRRDGVARVIGLAPAGDAAPSRAAPRGPAESQPAAGTSWPRRHAGCTVSSPATAVSTGFAKER